MKSIFRMVKARILGVSTILTIPKEIAEKSGIKPGDHLIVSYSEKEGIKIEKPEAKAEEGPGA